MAPPKTYRFVRRGDRGRAPTASVGPPCETLAMMSPEKQAEMVRLYGEVSPAGRAKLKRRAAIAAAAKKVSGR